MTLLLAFMGVDQKKSGPKPSSIYIASDSRISWLGGASFDFGRKVFGCQNSPEIFGYCGDVLFPSLCLNQIVDTIDRGLLFDPTWNCEAKFQAMINKFISIFNRYPKEVEGITRPSIEIIHASRSTDRTFFARKMKWTKSTNKWSAENVKFSECSDKLYIAGSGASEFRENFPSYHEVSRTSRAIFQCFCDTLDNIQDKQCGGPPQMYGLFRERNAIPFGIIQKNRRYFGGMEVTDLSNFNSILWRNELFERCDGLTMKKITGAQTHIKVMNL